MPNLLVKRMLVSVGGCLILLFVARHNEILVHRILAALGIFLVFDVYRAVYEKR